MGCTLARMAGAVPARAMVYRTRLAALVQAMPTARTLLMMAKNSSQEPALPQSRLASLS